MKNFILLLFFLIGFTFYGNSQAPSNNNCANAQSITLPTPGQTTCINGTTVGATTIFNNSFWVCQGNGQDVWYTFTTGADVSFTINFIRGTILNGVEINWFTQCPPGGLVGWVGCFNNNFSFTLNLQPNTTYYMLVYNSKSGSNSGQGTFQLCFQNNTPPSPTSISTNKESICILDTATLTVSGGVGTVHWFTGSCATSGSIGTGTTINVSPTVTTTYFARNFNNGAWSTACAFIEIIVDDCTLPIELVSFEAKPTIYNTVDLTWVTASELNNDFFTIERSIDGLNWEIVDTLSGAGTTNQENNYKLTDKRPHFGLSYYRLKQTDFDGTTEIFYPKSVFIETKDKTLVNIINTLGQTVSINTPGLVILVFSNGETLKILNQ
jgi:hypothetical protein